MNVFGGLLPRGAAVTKEFAGNVEVRRRLDNRLHAGATTSGRSNYRSGSKGCLGGGERKRRNQCRCRLGFSTRTGFDEAEVSAHRVMDHRGILLFRRGPAIGRPEPSFALG